MALADGLSFRRLRAVLAERGLVEALPGELNRQRDARSPVLKAGALIGATLVEAAVARPPLSEDEVSTEDLDAGVTRRGQKGFFGFKAHLAVDLPAPTSCAARPLQCRKRPPPRAGRRDPGGARAYLRGGGAARGRSAWHQRCAGDRWCAAARGRRSGSNRRASSRSRTTTQTRRRRVAPVGDGDNAPTGQSAGEQQAHDRAARGRGSSRRPAPAPTLCQVHSLNANDSEPSQAEGHCVRGFDHCGASWFSLASAQNDCCYRCPRCAARELRPVSA
mgnify:CR=1 FL=1